MTTQELLSDINNIKTAAERRTAHRILDWVDIPRGRLEDRVELLKWRYPPTKL